MMLFKYFQISKEALRQRRDRSLLTIIGIVCGIACITLLINFGLGAKQQIIGDESLSEDILTIRSGQSIRRDENGQITQYNLAQATGSLPNLTTNDLKDIEANNEIKQAAPLVNLNEEIKDLSGNKFENGHVIATNGNILELINYEIEYGNNSLAGNKKTVVIGDQVARELFSNSHPISHEIVIGDNNFIIIGVLKDPQKLNPLNISFNYRRSVLVPFATLETLNAEAEKQILIYEILAKTTKPLSNENDGLIDEINQAILINHGQKQDFTVFRNNELIFLTNRVFAIFRNLIVVISIIFLFISGIGLMNAMQASVAERKLEISLRKAVGATNQQIFNQFLMEALILSKVGGYLGVLAALFLGLLVDYWTPIQPVIQLDVIVAMIILAPVVGLLFGIQPAIQAALQKPEKALG